MFKNMRRRALFFLGLALLAAMLFLFLALPTESEQQHSGDNCRGCHGNRYTQQVIINDAPVPASIAMGEEKQLDITVMNDCRNQGNAFTGQYSSLNDGTNFWITSENDLVSDNLDGDPVIIAYIASQEEDSAHWTLTGLYDQAVPEVEILGELEDGKEVTLRARVICTGGGDETLDLHIEGHNSHENEVQITDDSYSLTVTNRSISALLEILIDGEVMDNTNIDLGDGEEFLFETSWTAKAGNHDITARLSPEDPGEADDSNNERTKNIDVAGDADLLISELELTDDDPIKGEELEVKATVANEGGRQADFDYSFLLNGDYLKNGSLVLDTGEVRELSHLWDSTDMTAGEHSLELVLDANNTVVETDETNNTWEIIFTLKELKAELWISELEMTDDEPTQGQELELKAKVENKGEAQGDFDYSFILDGEYLVNGSLVLDTGEMQELSYRWDSTDMTAGEHTLELVLDANNTVAETDETNNTQEISFTLKEPPAKPDAAIVHIELQRDPIFGYNTFYFTVKLQNLGLGWLNITAVVTLGSSEYYRGDLAFTPQMIKELNISATRVPGEYEINVELVNGDNEESDLNNNELSESVFVLELPRVSLITGLSEGGLYTGLSGNPTAGEQVEIKTRIRNFGDHEARITYILYLDWVELENGTLTFASGITHFFSYNWTALEGEHNFTLILDPVGPVALEENKAYLTLVVEAVQLPDLVITQLLIAPTTPLEGDTVSITATVEFPGITNISIEAEIDGVTVALRDTPMSDLKTVILQWESALEGSHTLKLVVLVEGRETAVEKTLEFSVGEAKKTSEEDEDVGFLSLGLVPLIVALGAQMLYSRRRLL